MMFSWISLILIAFLALIERGLLRAPGGIPVSFFLLPFVYVLGLRYGRGRMTVLPWIVALIVAGELLSPSLPGVSALLLGVVVIVGAQVGRRLTSVRLWWAHAIIGAMTLAIAQIVIGLVTGGGRHAGLLLHALWPSFLWSLGVFGLWCALYARQRWFHEPV